MIVPFFRPGMLGLLRKDITQDHTQETEDDECGGRTDQTNPYISAVRQTDRPDQ
ncbi:MAG: hypothetical protein ABIY70_18095 [Capsulimonas sp.]|uniref:hypothetical protein n=1 Tax=Capsulimonas sp. TaxID=2494211 RepID=UPI0032633C84